MLGGEKYIGKLDYNFQCVKADLPMLVRSVFWNREVLANYNQGFKRVNYSEGIISQQ